MKSNKDILNTGVYITVDIVDIIYYRIAKSILSL